MKIISITSIRDHPGGLNILAGYEALTEYHILNDTGSFAILSLLVLIFNENQMISK